MNQSINQQMVDRVLCCIDRVDCRDYVFTVWIGHGGVKMQGIYAEKDILTGEMTEQKTRPYEMNSKMTDSEIFQTLFLCALQSMEHRTREGFKVDGCDVFSPHYNTEDLLDLHKKGRGHAGSRNFKEAVY